jgi:hypothetical protein
MMTTYWQVAVSYRLPSPKPGYPPSKVLTTRYGLFLSLESAQAAVCKGAGVRVPFFDNYRGEYIYDPDQSPELSFVPGAYLITIEPVEVDDTGAQLIKGLKSLIEMACQADEAERRHENGRPL